MTPKTSLYIYLLSAMLTLLWTSVLRAQTFDENVLIHTPVTHDLYTAGRHIEIQAEVSGDLVAAGQMISVNDTVQEDIVAAGEIISLQGSVLDDVRVAGREIIVSNNIADHLVAAGESVTLESGSRVNTWAWLAGETVRVSGYIGQELKIAARHVIINGEINGDVELFAKQIDVLDRAHIHGDLIWHSEQQPQIENGGQIDGQVIEEQFKFAEHDQGSPLGGLTFMAASLMFAGVVIYLLFPGLPTQTAATLRHRPWLSLALGLAVLLLTPLVIAILFVTAVGSLLAFALLASYLVMILLGVISSIFACGLLGIHLLGKSEAAGKSLCILAFIITIFILGIIQLIPFVGYIIYLAVILFGLGGLSLAIFYTKQNSRI